MLHNGYNGEYLLMLNEKAKLKMQFRDQDKLQL